MKMCMAPVTHVLGIQLLSMMHDVKAELPHNVEINCVLIPAVFHWNETTRIEAT